VLGESHGQGVSSSEVDHQARIRCWHSVAPQKTNEQSVEDDVPNQVPGHDQRETDDLPGMWGRHSSKTVACRTVSQVQDKDTRPKTLYLEGLFG
jgi:hypothetical protein